MSWGERLAALAALELLCLDVDGVLTDGRLHYGPEGERLKVFHVHDGLGLKLLAREGIAIAVITAREGAPLARRLADLGVAHAWTGREDKGAAFGELLAKLGVPAERAAHVGDDLTDLPAMRRAGVSIAVANAVPTVRREAMLVTERAGGEGAVREICERILAARGRLEAAVERYLGGAGP